MKYVVQCTTPYVERFMVGIEAASPDEAIKKAKAMSETGDIMQASEEVPLLLDETEGDDSLVRFTIEQELAEDEPWPEPNGYVNTRHQHEAAFQVGKLLIEAHRRGEMRGSSIDWDELDLAYQAALQAAMNNEDPPRFKTNKRCSRLAVVLEGGIVQSVIADWPEAAPEVAVIDYDDEGQDSKDLCLITQSDGRQSKAFVIEPCVERARIDMNEVFRPIEP